MWIAIAAIAKAVEALFLFLVTTEGQQTVVAWRTSAELWNSTIVKAGKWLEDRFKLLKEP